MRWEGTGETATTSGRGEHIARMSEGPAVPNPGGRPTTEKTGKPPGQSPGVSVRVELCPLHTKAPQNVTYSDIESF